MASPPRDAPSSTSSADPQIRHGSPSIPIPTSGASAVPLVHPVHASLVDEDGGLLTTSSGGGEGAGSGGQSPRSRSPAMRPLSSVQALLRAGGTQTAHLSLSGPPAGSSTTEDGSTGGNSLRRPVDVVPSDTPRVAMPRPGQASRKASTSAIPSAASGEQSDGQATLSSASFAPPPPAASTFGSGLATSPRSLARRRASAIPLSSSSQSFEDGAGGAQHGSPGGDSSLGRGSGRAHVRTSAGKRPSTASGAGASGPSKLASGASFRAGSQSHQSSPVSGARATFLAGFAPGGNSTADDGGADVADTHDDGNWAGNRSASPAAGFPARLPSTADLGAHFRENDPLPPPPGPRPPPLPSPEVAADLARTASARELERRHRPVAVGEDGFDGLGLGRATDMSPGDAHALSEAHTASSTGYLPAMPSPDVHPVALAQQQQSQEQQEHQQTDASAAGPILSLGASIDAGLTIADRRPSITTGHAARNRPASASLPPGQSPAFDFRSSRTKNRNVEGWDWKNFIDAYAEGRWDPFKIPNPPLQTPSPGGSSTSSTFMNSREPSPRSHSGRFSLPHEVSSGRPGSTSAPSSSASVAPPRPGSPAARLGPLSTNGGGSYTGQGSYSSGTSPTSALPPVFPPPSSVSAPLGSPAQGGSRSARPSMRNEEFAGLVRLAGAHSNLSPFVLPSPEHEHVDPLRGYASPSREHPPLNLGVGAGGSNGGPRKTKSSSGTAGGRAPPYGGTWTATSKGMLPSASSASGAGGSGGSAATSVPPPSHSTSSGTGLHRGLDAIPATPFGEYAPDDSPEAAHPPSIPLATAPLPVTESGRAAKKAAAGDDYFGGPAQWQAAAAAATERDRQVAESLRLTDSPGISSAATGEDGQSPNSGGSGHEALISRRSSTWSMASDTGSADSSRTVLGRRTSHVDGFNVPPPLDGPPRTASGSSSSSSVPTQTSSAGSSRRGSLGKPGSLRFYPENVLPKEAAANEAFRAFLSQPFTPADLTAPSPPPAAHAQRPPLGPSNRSDGGIPPARIPLQSTQSDGVTRRASGGGAAASNSGGNGVPTVPGAPTGPAAPRTSSYQEQLFLEKGWLSAPKPPDELERRRALYRFNILRSGQDVNFDRISHMAKLVFATRMVLISMVDDTDQWYKSESGLNADGGSREPSLCAHVILQQSPEPMIVLDTHKDWRFRNNPLVKGKPNIRFYAGAPLRTPDGYNIGSLCVFDDKPRTEFSPRQRHVLKEFAAICMRELELFRDRLHLNRRAMIQDSMERFTKEVVEMDTTANVSLNVIYQEAASLIQKTLDVDGALILDLSAFELVETVDEDGKTSFRFQADQYVNVSDNNGGRSSMDASHDDEGDLTPATESRPVNFLARQNSAHSIPTLPVLGTAESLPTPKDRSRPLTAPEHQKIAGWLKEFPNGKIYERVVPPWMRHMVPGGIQYAMCCPIYNIDHNPFALVFAYTCNVQKQFLEGFELKYLRAIGLIILSAVLKRRLLLADKAKSQFISNISHELRTPLHGILLSSELMSDTKLDDQQSSYLQTVQACGISLIETVNHVLDYTKLSGNTGRVSGTDATDRGIQKSEVDLAQLIEETVEGCWMGQRARALIGDSEIGSVYAPPPSTVLREDGQAPLDRPQVECVVDIPWREDGWRVNLEKGGVRRVLMNLVSNALKFTSDGYVLVTLRALPCPEGAEAIPLEIAVIDTGKGISKDFLQSQLFQPFSQENPLQTGTGLGLAIVNSIVSSDAVRGKVDVWSTVSLGTEIKVSLDAAPARRRHSVDSNASLVDFGLGFSVTFLGFDERIRGYKLLRDVLEMNLQDWGFDARPSTIPGWGDILLVNESERVIDHFTEQGNVGRPIVIFSTSRSAVEQLRAVHAYREAGGFATLVFKPAGPVKIMAAMRACVQAMTGSRRPSEGSRRSSNLSATSDSPRVPVRTPSELDIGSPYSAHSNRSYSLSLDDDRTYFSGLPGASSTSSASASGTPSHVAAHAGFKQQVLLQRRRSEDERDQTKRRAKRPSMGGRSITFQPDQASPLAFNGYSGAANPQPMNAPRKPSSEFEAGPSTPSSPGSTISIIGGGVLLKSAVAPNSEVAAIREAVVKSQSIPKVLVCEDNVINRRVLSAFLRKKGFSFIETCDGQEGVDMFESKGQNYFDVILMDVSMPVLDGLSATRAIRSIESARRSAHSRSASLPTTPDPALRDQLLQRAKILALTGLATPEDKKKAFSSGVDGYLIKPVSLKTLDAVFKSFGYGL